MNDFWTRMFGQQQMPMGEGGGFFPRWGMFGHGLHTPHQVGTGGPGQAQGFPSANTGGGYPAQPMGAYTGGNDPASSYPQAFTGGNGQANQSPNAYTGGPMQPSSFGAYTGGNDPASSYPMAPPMMGMRRRPSGGKW